MVSDRRGSLYLRARIGCVISLWHSLGLPYDYFDFIKFVVFIGICDHSATKCASCEKTGLRDFRPGMAQTGL